LTDRAGKARITVKVMAVLPDADGRHHLVLVGHDPTKTTDAFHRLLGGHLEFDEAALDGIRREISEETGTTLEEPRLLGVLENRFVHDGQPGHEVVFVYSGRLAEPDVVPPGGGILFDEGTPMPVVWRPFDAPADAPPLYPDGLVELLEVARGR
jgi:ADP-ribose pyrophosphatase YjhB (NUDIX family)